MKIPPHYLSLFLLVFLFVSLSPTFSQETKSCDLPRFSPDSGLLQRAAAAIQTKPGADVVILCEFESYVFDATNKITRTSYLTYRVLSAKGAEGWDSLTENWEPWHQDKPVLRVRVIGSDGSSHELDPRTIKDETASDEQEKVYSDGRVIRAPLPAITPGAIVEQEVLVSDKEAEFKEGTLHRFFVGGGVPVEESRLLLDAPAALALSYEKQMLPDIKVERVEADGRVRLTFRQGHADSLEDVTPHLPNDIPGRPAISFATGKNWQSVAAAYSAIVDKQIDGASLKGEVSRITQGKQTNVEKIESLLEFLSKEIRYTGVEFGDAAIVPHSPAETLKHKYGDCKDKATLMVAMLRSADMPAYVALLNVGSRQDVPFGLPGLGLFDHAIVYLPGNPEYWIDVTDEYARIGELPSSDQGRLSLIAKPDTTGLTKISQATSRDNLIFESRQVFLAENGPARIIETTEPHGAYESLFRSYYADVDNKDTKKNLKDYVANMYLADKLDKSDRTEPKQLTQQFKLTLEANKAKRATTDLDAAVVAIRVEELFNRLPDDLLQQEKEEKKETSSEEPRKKPRTDDYQLPAPFTTEWRYRIFPPPGFQAKPLPSAKNEQVGPATYAQEFQLQPDGSVEGLLRFDTVKRRFTAGESNELRKAVLDLRSREPILIWFEPKAVALRNAGKPRESLQAYRELVALHPKEGLHHLQVAKALLGAGLGNGAREEAQLAVKLEPTSALAQKTLAEILEYDLVGRKFRPGSDYTGAAEAYRAAIKLDTDDKASIANLALLLEYDQWGLRYGPGAKLKESVVEYRKLTKDDLSGFGLQNNIAFALFYAGDFTAAQTEAQNLNPLPKALLVACESIINGSQVGRAEAKKRASNDDDAASTAKVAGQMLVNLRKYDLGAALLEAGTSGANASGTAADALAYKRTIRREQLVLSDDPKGLALKLYILETNLEVTADQFSRICSKNGARFLAAPDVVKGYIQSQREVSSSASRQGYFPEVGIDLAVTRAQPTVEGNDATAYRVAMWPSANYKNYVYVVKEEGHYKALATSTHREGVALEILDRIAAGDLPAARVLLDWLREDDHLAIGDDPLSGGALPRLWTKGKNGEVSAMKLAAAAVLANWKDTAKMALDILETTAYPTASDAEKQGIDLAKRVACARIMDLKRGIEITTALYNQYPDSRAAFFSQLFQLRLLSKFDAADRLLEDRQKRLPDDADIWRGKEVVATDRGDYVTAHSIAEKLVADGKADASDLNSLTWHSIFTGNVTASDIENGLKSVQLSGNPVAALHTVGCAYAEVGKTKEAKDVLIQAMDKLNMDDPDDNYWYAFGRIAEQYGEQVTARIDYQKLKKPEYDFQIPDSSYKLAQIRLAAMGKPPAQAGK